MKKIAINISNIPINIKKQLPLLFFTKVIGTSTDI